MMVLVPLMQTLVFGYAINYDVKHLKTIVLDEDRSYDSRELVAKMASEPVLRRRRARLLLRRAAPRDGRGPRRSTALVIDRDYGKNRRRGVPAAPCSS
jgi:ABC-2 type transport system permease protein